MDNKASTTMLGFVGVGLMGQGLAKNASKAGYPVALLVRSTNARERSAELLEAGALAYATPQEVAAHANLLVICVTGAPEVEDVVFGRSGVLEGIRPGTVVIDCSTSLPATSRRVAEAVQARGGNFLDAAMTGTPKEAAEGAVNLLIGGEAAVLEAIRPVLQSFSRNIYHCGPVGAGHTIKLLHQYVVLGNAAILAEAFSLATKAEVDLPVLCDVIASGGANSTAFQRFRHYVLEGDDTHFRFSLANALKDMKYFAQMADDAQVSSSIGTTVRSVYMAANDAGYSEQYVPHLVEALDEQGTENLETGYRDEKKP